MTLFTIEREKCRRDGNCVEECPSRIIEIREKGGFPTPVENAEELCIDCGHCVAVCPHGAFRLGKMNPEDCVPIDKKMLHGFEDTEHLLKSRRSIRAYKEDLVDRSILAKLIDVARYAPSGHNRQPVHWLVIERPAEVKHWAGLVIDWMNFMLKEEPEFARSMHFDLAAEAWQKGTDRIFRDAPHVIAAHGLKELSAAQPACIIALTYLELASYGMGVGACWAGYFTRAAASFAPLIEALRIPNDHQIYGALMIGYPKHRYRRIPLRNKPEITWR
jgi:nitroreductase/NAD-dependent dihydropyrimidine dehydrogenase PreA subunit